MQRMRVAAMLLQAAFYVAGGNAAWAAAVRDVEAPRVAVFASGSDKAEAIVTLLEARLSRSEDVVLLDRQHVREVLKEHRISLENAWSGPLAMRVGQVLPCDVFCELRWRREEQRGREGENGKNADEVASLVAFDAATGVRVLDVPFPIDLTVDAAVAAARSHVENAARKREGLATATTHTVSVWAAHGIALPPRSAWVPGTIRVLLQRRLVNQPNIALLERTSLGLLRKEHDVTGTPLLELLLSSFCLDLDVSKGEQADGILVRMTISDIRGKEIDAVQCEGSATRLDALVEALLDGLSERLGIRTTPAGPEQLVLEAKRILMSDPGLSSVRAARVLMEAAFAMQPDHSLAGPSLRGVLMQEFFAEGVSPEEQLDILHRTMDLLDRMDELNVRDVHGRVPTRIREAIMRIAWSTSGEWPRYACSLIDLKTRERQDRYRVFLKRVLERYVKQPVLVGPDLQMARALTDTEEEAISLFLQLGTRIPRYDVQQHLGFEALAAAVKQVRHGKPVACDVARFSAENKRRLLDLYETAWRKDGRIQDNVTQLGDWRISAAMAHAYLLRMEPKLADNPEEQISRLLRRAADLAIEDAVAAPDFVRRLIYLEDYVFSGGRPACGPIPPQPIRFPEDIAVAEVKRILRAFVAGRRVAEDVLVFLDWFDSENAEKPGAYIETAVSQWKNKDYRATRCYTYRGRLSKAEALASLYRYRYGRDLAEIPENKAAAPSLRIVKRMYDCAVSKKLFVPPPHSDVPPGKRGKGKHVPTILSAKAQGKDLYLLIGLVRLTGNLVSEEDRLISCVLGRLDMKSGRFGAIGRHKLYIPGIQGRAEPLDCLYGGNRFFLAEGSAYFKEKDCLVRMELDGGRTSRVLADGRLPISTLSGLAGAGGKLYLAVKNHLLRCNPDGTEIEILAAAHSARDRSPLDRVGPRNAWTIHGLAVDEKGNRLLFPVKFGLGGDGYFACDLDSGAVTRLKARPVTCEGKSNLHVSFIWDGNPRIRNYDENRFLVQNGHKTFLLQPDEGTLNLYFGPFWGFKYAVDRAAGPENPCSSPYLRDDRLALTEKDGFVIHSDWAGLFRIVGPKVADKSLNPGWDVELREPIVPVLLTKHDGHIVAVTRDGVWLLDLRLPTPTVAERAAEEDATDGPVGRLTVRSPVGGTLKLDNEAPYRFWPNRPLNWNRIPIGPHRIEFVWCGRKWTETIHIKQGEWRDVTVFPKAGIEKTMELDLDNGVKMQLAWISPGEGRMGDKAKGELKPVRIDEGFWMGIYEVTVQQFRTVLGLPDPDVFEGDRYPATFVSWEQANEFCRRLTARCGTALDGMVVRLPWEKEWEYACRAGTETLYYSGETRDSMATTRHDLRKQPLFESLKHNRLEARCVAIGQRTPNLFGLHDMCSNVSEWCLDRQPGRTPVRRFGLTGTYRSPRWSGERNTPWYDGFRVVVTKPR